jgi:hypothetical protein
MISMTTMSDCAQGGSDHGAHQRAQVQAGVEASLVQVRASPPPRVPVESTRARWTSFPSTP